MMLTRIAERPTSRITAGLAKWPYFREAWCCVAVAKIHAFARQCERLGELAHVGVVDRAEAAAVLTDIATAHSLGETFGSENVNAMIAEVFAPPVVQAEAAE